MGVRRPRQLSENLYDWDGLSSSDRPRLGEWTKLCLVTRAIQIDSPKLKFWTGLTARTSGSGTRGSWGTGRPFYSFLFRAVGAYLPKYFIRPGRLYPYLRTDISSLCPQGVSSFLVLFP